MIVSNAVYPTQEQFTALLESDLRVRFTW